MISILWCILIDIGCPCDLQINNNKYFMQTFAFFVYLFIFQGMNKKVTIKDIARELGTTNSTVSRALNNHSAISEGKRRLIIEKAGEMGYEPNILARNLRQGASNVIGLIVPQINRVFFSNVIHGIETVARQEGFSVIICQSNEAADIEEENIKTLLGNNVAGIIMSLSKETEKPGFHREISGRNIPFVMFDRVLTDMETSRVLNDNFQGAYAVTEHLIDQGYREIVHFAGPSNINIYHDRREGFKKALEDHGFQVKREQVRDNVITKEAGYRETESLLKPAGEVDAIFAASDYSALGAMLCLQDRQVSVPEEIGVAGFANEPFTELVNLTSVEQHSSEIGKSAARLLFEGIAQDGAGKMNKEVIIKPELIIRNSTLKKKAYEIQ
jgi:LacI family transcriptional regulator